MALDCSSLKASSSPSPAAGSGDSSQTGALGSARTSPRIAPSIQRGTASPTA